MSDGILKAIGVAPRACERKDLLVAALRSAGLRRVLWTVPKEPSTLILRAEGEGPVPFVFLEVDEKFILAALRRDTHTRRPYVVVTDTEAAAHQIEEQWAREDLEQRAQILLLGVGELERPLIREHLRVHLESGRTSQPCFPPPPPTLDSEPSRTPAFPDNFSAAAWVRGTFHLTPWRAPRF